ncbi:MAG: glycosyltransferase [Phycisphaerales bacterium]|nr:glycosyltransferase [Phycisphaerales bacterium]
MKPLLSFIIPAWNEEDYMAATIESIQHAAKEYAHEIIVVNDNSDDETAAIARGLGVTVIDVNHRHIAATRNSGAAIAKGKHLVFVDADTIVYESVVDEMVEVLGTGFVAGSSFPTFDGKLPFIAKVLTPFVRYTFLLLRLGAGAFIFCTRDAFEHVGGFPEKFFAAEEVHLSHTLHKQGKFKTLKARVLTSGRKFRTHSSIHILMTLFLVAIPGIRRIKQRKSLWYGDRRREF